MRYVYGLNCYPSPYLHEEGGWAAFFELDGDACEPFIPIGRGRTAAEAVIDLQNNIRKHAQWVDMSRAECGAST